MRKNLLQTLLFSVLLMLLGQCTYDRPQGLVEPRLTAERLASNADFVELIKITNNVEDVLYNNLRDARSQRVRDANLGRISALLKYQDNKDSLALAIRKMGFSNVNQFLLDVNQANLLNDKLKTKGVKLAELQPDLLAEACGLTSKKLGHKYPTIFSASAGNDNPAVLSSAYGICELCHFNNCEECNDSGGGDQTIDAPGGPSGGGAYSCRAEAEVRRQNTKNIATAAFIAGLGGCGWLGVDVGTGVTGILIGTGPAAPVFGTVAGLITTGGCLGIAAWTYDSTLNIIESNYRTELSNCRN